MLHLLCATTAGTAVHPDRLAMIEQIESTPGLLWKPAPHPRFAASAPGEALKPLMGVVGDWKAALEEGKRKGELEEYAPKPGTSVPDSFDSAENWPQCAKMINDSE